MRFDLRGALLDRLVIVLAGIEVRRDRLEHKAWSDPRTELGQGIGDNSDVWLNQLVRSNCDEKHVIRFAAFAGW